LNGNGESQTGLWNAVHKYSPDIVVQHIRNMVELVCEQVKNNYS